VIAKKLGEVTGHHEQHLKRLGNPDFMAKAAPEMREETQQRAQELETQRHLLSEQLRILGEAH
jgi:valyl-tRNA synthetase